jgi:hypothetical protein
VLAPLLSTVITPVELFTRLNCCPRVKVLVAGITTIWLVVPVKYCCCVLLEVRVVVVFVPPLKDAVAPLLGVWVPLPLVRVIGLVELALFQASMAALMVVEPLKERDILFPVVPPILAVMVTEVDVPVMVPVKEAAVLEVAVVV